MSFRSDERPTVYDSCKALYRWGAKHKGTVGIEIETETKNPYEMPRMAFWNTTGDGSLRDFGVEYVLKQPVGCNNKDTDELKQAMAEFQSKTNGFKFIKDSISTSVHVHLNMLNEDFLTIANFLTAYTLTENILIRYSGPDRLSNLFCLPMCDAEATVDNCQKFITAIKTFKYNQLMFENQRVKYAALNLASFSRFGSLEVRSFRGETDVEQIEKWVRILHKILKYSQGDRSPKSIMESWRERKNNILDDIYEEYAYDLTQAIPKKEKPDDLLLRNGWYAAKLATCIKDWEKYAVHKVKKITRGKYLDILNTLGLQQFGKNYDDLSEFEKFVIDEMYIRSTAGNNQGAVFPDDEGVLEAENIRDLPPVPNQRRRGAEINEINMALQQADAINNHVVRRHGGGLEWFHVDNARFADDDGPRR